MEKNTIINEFLEKNNLKEHELVYWKHKISICYSVVLLFVLEWLKRNVQIIHFTLDKQRLSSPLKSAKYKLQLKSI